MMAGLQACNVMVETCIPALLPEVWQASCLCRKPLLRNLTQQPAELVALVKGMRSTLGEYDGMGWRFGTKQLYAILVSYSFMQCHYIIQWGQDTPWWDLPQSPSAKPGISLFPRVRSGRLFSLPLATGSGAPRLLDMNLYNPYPQEQTPCSMVRRGFWHFDSILPSIQWKCGHLGRHPSQLPLQLKLYALVDLHEGPGLESSIPWSILDSVWTSQIYMQRNYFENPIFQAMHSAFPSHRQASGKDMPTQKAPFQPTVRRPKRQAPTSPRWYRVRMPFAHVHQQNL